MGGSPQSVQWWALANAPVQQTSAGPAELGGNAMVARDLFSLLCVEMIFQYISWKTAEVKFLSMQSPQIGVKFTVSYQVFTLSANSRLQRICYSHWENGARNGVI